MTALEGCAIVGKVFAGRTSREADVPAQETPQAEAPRIPRADAHPRRAERAQTPEGEGTPPGVDLAPRMPSPPYLTASEDFRQAYREGTRIANDRIVLHVRTHGTGPARIGIAVRRQLGGAVRRNRMKRRLREASTSAYPVLPGGIDVVIVPRTAAADASFEELRAAVAELFGRARAGARP